MLQHEEPEASNCTDMVEPLRSTMSSDESNPDNKDPYQGVKIQKLPTVGSPLTVKGHRWRGNYVTTKIRRGYRKKHVREVVKALS